MLSPVFTWSGLVAVAIGGAVLLAKPALAPATNTVVSSTAAAAPDPARFARGRYLVQIAGCNDCHTANYARSGGKIPERDWLKGDATAWHGGWGTTYPSNLRLLFATMSEEQWLTYARVAEARPPMPWFNLRAMSDADLLAIHSYIHALGPAGEPAPQYQPPGEPPRAPYVDFVER